MTRFFDSHAWNTRRRETPGVKRCAADVAAAGATIYLSAERADATVRAGTALQPETGASDTDWLVGGGRVQVRGLVARPGCR